MLRNFIRSNVLTRTHRYRTQHVCDTHSRFFARKLPRAVYARRLGQPENGKKARYTYTLFLMKKKKIRLPARRYNKRARVYAMVERKEPTETR